MKARTLTVWMTGLLLSASFTSNAQNVPVATGRYTPDWDNLDTDISFYHIDRAFY